MEGAARSRLGGVPAQSGEVLTLAQVREKVSVAASQLLVAVEVFSGEVVLQKPSEARNATGTARELVHLATELELLEAVGDLPDDPETLVKLLKDLVALAKKK